MLTQLASLARIDFGPRHRQPQVSRVLPATIAAVAGSLAADGLPVVIAQAVFTAPRDAFQFPDYDKLTVIGVIVACVAWPVITRISSGPRAVLPPGHPGAPGAVAARHLHSSTAASRAARSPSSSACAWRSRWSTTTC